MVRAALVCGLLALAPLAHAEGSAPASADQIKPAQPSQHLSQVAERHFRTGLDFYRAGDYASGRVEFQAASDLSHLPDLLHNLSRGAQLEGMLAEAVAFEERYITEGADKLSAEEIDQARERITLVGRAGSLGHQGLGQVTLAGFGCGK